MLVLVKDINRLAGAYYDPISIVSFAEKSVIFVNWARPKEIKGMYRINLDCLAWFS